MFFAHVQFFLFSAISLVVPSGFSYGAALLVLGSFALLYLRPRFALQRHDWVFILTLAGYVFIYVSLNIYHNLPANAYDKLLRYLLVIPVYFLLISYPSTPNYFWCGVAVGAFGAGIFAIYQVFIKVVWLQRAYGFLNPIQFGDISLLMAALSVICCLSFFGRYKFLSLILIVSSIMGLCASLLSGGRGGWLAIPVVIFVVCKMLKLSIRNFFLLIVSFSFVISLGLFLSPNENFLKNRIILIKSEVSEYINNDAYSLNNASFGTRVKMWQNGVDAFKSKPILGWGSLTAIKNNYPAEWFELNNYDSTLNHLHNEYIDALAKKGLVGFTALMAMYLIPLYYFIGLMRTRQADVMPFAAAGVVLILCVMVFGLTQCFLAHNSGTMVFVFYLVIIKAYCRNIVAARSVAGVDASS